MLGKVKVENLPTYIRKIEKLFPEFRSGADISTRKITAYYKESFWGYALFHSWAGAIHMALSEGGRFSKNDYFRQAEELADILQRRGGRGLKVLEVGCGRGFNVKYLAHRFPSCQFVGADISDANVRSAMKAARGISNLSIVNSDFHQLAEFEDDEFDAVLAVETLCHATAPKDALQAISRVLAEGGSLVVFDGFRSPQSPDELTEKAVHYTERAMAVPEFLMVSRFNELAQCSGLRPVSEEDRSAEVMPNLIRLSDLAKAFFKVELASRLVLLALPRGLVTNSIAGLLMAVTVQSGAHRYMKLVFAK